MFGRIIDFFNFKKKARAHSALLYPQQKQILGAKVPFYVGLNAEEKVIFESEVSEFLEKVDIRGIDTEVEELDRMLIAASAVIPLFAFRDWFYPNLIHVDLCSDAFNKDFQTEGSNRNILGMVGSGGVMNGKMILSKKALRLGFENYTDKRNTAVHEFAHLIDMSDGSTDGLPEYLLKADAVQHWIELIRQKITDIKENNSDIDSYGATNEAEFFAVASEYFFERPELLQAKHPDLFALMEQVFKRKPVVIQPENQHETDRNSPCWCGSGKKFKKCHGAS
jgi:MtfA peptidase